jgi:hypothetical protein
MSFTSLQDGGETRDPSLNKTPDDQSGVGAIPLSFGTFESSHSGTRVPSAEPSQVSYAPTGGYEAGNLAALEDHAAEMPMNAGPNSRASQRAYAYDRAVLTPGHPQSRPGQQQPHSYPSPPQYPDYPDYPVPPAPGPAQTRLPMSYWVVTATLVAAGAAIGAYLAGVFS